MVKRVSVEASVPQRARPTIKGKVKESPRETARAPVHAARGKSVQRPAVHEAPSRMRRHKLLQSDDMFYLPVEEIPEDAVYEWKRYSVMGQEDPYYIAQMREQGWEPVDPKRHPNWLPPGYDKPYIIKGGLILMERPLELQREARKEERGLSTRQVRDAEARLGMTPKGELTRNFPGVEPRITKEWNRPVRVGQEVPQGEG